MNFDQTWEKYENGFGDFQGERHSTRGNCSLCEEMNSKLLNSQLLMFYLEIIKFVFLKLL